MTEQKWVYNGVEFKPGDRVKVVRFEADGAEDAMGDGIQWDNSWNDGMDQAIGKEFEISSIDDMGVLFTDWVEMGYDAVREYAIYAYPLSVLEKLQ